MKRLPAAMAVTLLTLAATAADAGERGRSHPAEVRQPRVGPSVDQRWRREGRGGTERRWRPESRAARFAERADPDDTPYGPTYQSQEQVRQSIYDVAAGRRGNIKEYWRRR